VPTVSPLTRWPGCRGAGVGAIAAVRTGQRHAQHSRALFALGMLNFTVQVVARPWPTAATDLLCRLGEPPAKALVVGILSSGIQPRGGRGVRDLLEEPILVVVALATV